MPRIHCAACRRPLTRDCRWGGPDDHDRLAQEGRPAVPEGLLVRLPLEDATVVRKLRGKGRKRVDSPAGAIAAHPADLLADALKSAGIDNGCCGSDGLDGPNRACRCGRVVGTEWSDCWTQAEVRFLPDRVTATDA